MKKCEKFIKRCFILVAAFLLVCSMELTVSAAGSPAINKKTASLTVGKTVQLKVKNAPGKVSWSSSNKKIATVSANGKVKGVKAGKATITAKVSGKKYTCQVTVKNANARASKVRFKNATGGDFVRGGSNATISFMLKKTSTAVEVRIQTSAGKTVYTKTYAKCKENTVYSFNWNGKKKNGSYAATGSYKLCIVAGTTKTYSKELILYPKDFQAGDGSKKAPYQVKTLQQLKNVNKYNGRYFVQVANISGGNANFVPLFSSDSPFTGVYNGKGYTISNLYFRKIGDAGIFASIGETGIVRNLKASNLTFAYSGEGNYWSGHCGHGLIAGVNKGTISNCKAENSTMKGIVNTAQGGICGINEKEGSIQNCSAKGMKISNSGNSKESGAGGIVGTNRGTVSDCTASDITLTAWYAGGIAGKCGLGKMYRCGSSDTLTFVNCEYRYGAVIGYAEYSEIYNCYTDTEYELIGYNYMSTVQ